MRRTAFFAVAISLCASSSFAQRTFKPSPEELAKAYQRANEVQRMVDNAAFNVNLTYGWLPDDAGVWFRMDKPGRKREFLMVDAKSRAKRPLFDHQALAVSLAEVSKKSVDATSLPLDSISVKGDSKVAFRAFGADYLFDPASGKVVQDSGEAVAPPLVSATQEEPNPEYPVPDSGYEPTALQQQELPVRVRQGQIQLRSGSTWTTITTQGSYARADQDPTTRKILGFKLIPGDRRLVYLLKSAMPNSTRATLEERMYDQPGDKLDEFEVWLIDPTSKSETKLDLAPIMGGGQPWAFPPGVRWKSGGAFFDFPIRGYQRHKLVRVDMASGTVKTLVDETSSTFIDQSKTNFWLLADGKRLIWQSERTGRSHLYSVDIETAAIKPITSGDYIVRGVEIDERSGKLLLGASGFGNPATEDPYHTHLISIDLDGGNFKRLTKADGHHFLTFSPGKKLFFDSYSRTDLPPVHEIRDAQTGDLIAELGRADVQQVARNGLSMPERFVAKGRDGKTDIWGIVIRPTNFDKNRKYPVIENIYAGPHDSFVPKGYRPFFNMQRLAELGFIVVQIDGMGTNNRGKAFHDVAWRNVADAGFPDRILWMKALGAKYPQVDISRVGVYGTSAGGQSSTGAMLFHGDFYKVAVSSCGCHDNRIDKQWWNEQWMGYPVATHYDEQSNISNAAKLKGKLMLIVGEQDRNVPPESTFRLADALIKARKNFDLVVIPGADHTDGGPYGERKRRDFFVRWLHDVEPPPWND